MSKDKIFFDSYSDINELAIVFNSFNFSKNQKIYFLEEEKAKIFNIINAINVGIVAVGRDENIYFSNNFAQNIFGIKSENINYREYLRNHIFIDLINNSISKKENISSEVFLGNKEFFASSIFGMQNVILIISDISDYKKLEVIKRDFITNIAHELRTPLSSIIGFLDTMLEIKEYNEDFVFVMKNNADRIIKIVNDLVNLSRLENFNEELKIETIDKNDLENYVVEVYKTFESKIKEKSLEFSYKIDSEILFDRNMFYTVLVNLVSNAIRYTNEGKIEVKITSKYLLVKDSGIGIDEKYFDRIFERFYVIYKSRSKEHGGIGVGLSIVKHIIKLHDYNISVSSDSSGTQFTIFF